jgi:RES domain-containing protein
MRVFRIERKRYLATTLTGQGASLASGFRWNSESTRLVYTAATRSLAMLEIMAHLDASEDLPTDRFFVEIEVPDALAIRVVEANDLPEGWDARPPNRFTQRLGDEFVRNPTAAVLQVPSAIIPEEFNFLLNPAHPDARRLQIVKTTPLQFDARMRPSSASPPTPATDPSATSRAGRRRTGPSLK